MGMKVNMFLTVNHNVLILSSHGAMFSLVASFNHMSHSSSEAVLLPWPLSLSLSFPIFLIFPPFLALSDLGCMKSTHLITGSGYFATLPTHLQLIPHISQSCLLFPLGILADKSWNSSS